MALKLGDDVIDLGMAAFASANKIVICSQVPTSYAEANTYALGSKDFGVGNVFGSIGDDSHDVGRKVDSVAVTDGDVLQDGTPVCWAVLDDANDRLLASGPMTNAVGVTSGQFWTLDSFTIVLPGTPYTAPVLLLHMDGTDGSTAFIDATGRHNVTAHGNVQVDTAQSVFGGASAYFNQSTSNWLSLDNNSDFTLPGDFTIDLRVHINSSTSAALLVHSDNDHFRDTAGTWSCLYYGNAVSLWVPSASFSIVVGSSFPVDQWRHIEITRSGNMVRTFLNGVLQNSAEFSGTLSTTELVLGQDDANNSFNGWIDEVRIIKGYAAHTANFTPPSAPYTY